MYWGGERQKQTLLSRQEFNIDLKKYEVHFGAIYNFVCLRIIWKSNFQLSNSLAQ